MIRKTKTRDASEILNLLDFIATIDIAANLTQQQLAERVRTTSHEVRPLEITKSSTQTVQPYSAWLFIAIWLTLLSITIFFPEWLMVQNHT